MVSLSERQHILAACPLCVGLTAAAREELCVAATTRSIAATDYLFSEDEPATSCYVLAHGLVRLSKLAATGEQVILRIVQPPDPVGIIAILPQAVYPLSALALRPCSVIAWDHATLTGLIERHPLLAVRALHLVSGRFIELQQQYLERNVERVERRLARTLVRLANQVGRRGTRGRLDRSSALTPRSRRDERHHAVYRESHAQPLGTGRHRRLDPHASGDLRPAPPRRHCG
ncbi:MAG: Crp/Fnr family transcriptional regulator [Blastochloris sp.]|nr:Crp/Fnr family transcriptional regulator [Blastochloris sp.]